MHARGERILYDLHLGNLVCVATAAPARRAATAAATTVVVPHVEDMTA